jgi:hypothetical protein
MHTNSPMGHGTPLPPLFFKQTRTETRKLKAAENRECQRSTNMAVVDIVETVSSQRQATAVSNKN